MNELITYETYKPSQKQLEAHLSDKRFKLFGGAMNCGKSFWLCAEAIRLSLMFPRNAGVIARYRFKDLKRSTLPILLQMIPNNILKSYNKSEGIIELINKSVIYCSDAEDANKFKSMNLGWFALDEPTDIPTEDVFNMLTTRLRLILPNIKHFGLCATNPEPGWVKEKWITQAHNDFKFFAALPKDNPAYSQEYIDSVASTLPASLRARYLEGSWDAFDDNVFRPEWVIPAEPHQGLDMVCKITFVDPAVSEKTTADETAIVTIGLEETTGLIYDLEVIHGRWTYEEINNQVQAVYTRHKPDLLFVETVQAQDWLRQDLVKRGIPALGFKPDIDKFRKALSIQHFFEQGKIHINNRDLSRQLIEFPKGVHDDIADALISALVCMKRYSMENLPDNKSQWWKASRPKSWRDTAQGLSNQPIHTQLKRLMTGE